MQRRFCYALLFVDCVVTQVSKGYTCKNDDLGKDKTEKCGAKYSCLTEEQCLLWPIGKVLSFDFAF